MTPIAALILLPFATAIGVWVAWSDMKSMKIPNQSVLALLAVWLIVGIFVVRGVAGYLSDLFMAKAGRGVARDMRVGAMARTVPGRQPDPAGTWSRRVRSRSKSMLPILWP